jgi:hypothetical protein
MMMKRCLRSEVASAVRVLGRLASSQEERGTVRSWKCRKNVE